MYSPTLMRAIHEVMRELMHVTFIFPEDSDGTVTFTAGVADNAWSDWAEIVDNNAVTFSSKIANRAVHLSSIQIEETDTKDKVYLIEIAYGGAKVNVAAHRFVTGDLVKLPTIQQIRLRPDAIPAGETHITG